MLKPSRALLSLALLGAFLLSSPDWVAQNPASAEELPEAPVLESAADSAESNETSKRGKAYSHMMRAVFASRRGEFRRAAAEIRSAIELQPESIDVHIQGATMMQWMGRQTDAEQLAQKALELDPNSASAISYLADLASSKAISATRDEESRALASKLYDRLAEIRPLEESELRKLANLRMLNGDLEGSIDAARRLLEERPGDNNAARLLVQLLLRQGNAGEAQRTLLRYLAKHPNDTDFLEEARSLTNDLAAWHVVLELLHGNADLDGRATATHALIGEALLRASKMEAAVEALEAAMLHNSSEPAVRYNLCLAYRGSGRLADAAAIAREMSNEYPGHATVQRLLAETLESQRDIEGALNAYAAALRILTAEAAETADDPDARSTRDGMRLRIAQIELGRERIPAAETLWAELEDASSAEALHVGGEIALKRKDWAEARQVARKLRALELHGSASMLEGQAWLGAGRPAKALPKFQEAISESGPFARIPVANSLREGGLTAEGEALLRDWRKANPENADISFQLGVYLYESGRLDEAEVWMRRAIQLEPKHAPALNYLGYSLAERGQNLPEALAMIQQALSLDASNGAYLDSLGWTLFQMGDLDAAKAPLERAAREYPKDWTILEHLGDIYAGLGEHELALVTWNRAADAAPGGAQSIQDKIEALHAQNPDKFSTDASAQGNPDSSPKDPARN